MSKHTKKIVATVAFVLSAAAFGAAVPAEAEDNVQTGRHWCC